MKVYLGADHRGFEIKEKIRSHLSGKGYEIVDRGAFRYEPTDDFTDFSFAVAEDIAAATSSGVDTKLPESMGIVFCGSGGGVTIAANKVRGIRCGQGINVDDVVHNRKHDNINVLAIGTDYVSAEDAQAMVTAFLTTPYESQERFVRRLNRIRDYEMKNKI